MTTTTETEVVRRGRPAGPKNLPLFFELGLTSGMRREFDKAEPGPRRKEYAEALGIEADDHWPSERYRLDPTAFSREVLGVRLWEKQVEILEAVRDHARVAVASGHKVGKSMTAAVVALWYFCTHAEARVVMSSVTARQVDQILWRELRMLHRRATKPIGGELHELARSGLKAADFREIVGFTAREAEAVAGISGKNLLYILDEASGIGRDIFEAIEGNRAGGAKVLMTSNPTRSDGDFFDAFHKYKAGPDNPNGVHCIQVSSEDSPNVVAGRTVIPGLAGPDWVEEKKREWGEESALYLVRVKGQFVRREEGRVISLHTIELAEQRWKDAIEDGPLVIGLDPAGDGISGDETVFAIRRGLKVTHLIGMRGLSERGIRVNLIGLVEQYGRSGERPRVVFDCEGEIGTRVLKDLRMYLEFDVRGDPKPFDIVPIKASAQAYRYANICDRQRDALWWHLNNWLRPIEEHGQGGAIPEDAKLAAELHAPEWKEHARRDGSVLKVTPKPELRKMLGRSPDRADAVALAVWDVRLSDHPVEDRKPAPEPRKPVLDPYGGAIDPYGRRR